MKLSTLTPEVRITYSLKVLEVFLYTSFRKETKLARYSLVQDKHIVFLKKILRLQNPTLV